LPRCEHGGERFRVCAHLRDGKTAYVERFTGRGIEHAMVCDACGDVPDDELDDVCAACRDVAKEDGRVGFTGKPGVIEAPHAELRFESRTIASADFADVVDAQPLIGDDRSAWIGVTRGGRLVAIDLDRGTTSSILDIGALDLVDLDAPISLHVARRGRFAAVVNRTGVRGAVIDLARRQPTMTLPRDGYHAQHCVSPIAFIERGDRTLIVASPAWNRLDVFDAADGTLLTARESPAYGKPGDPRPAHYLDYFHCGLSLSPDQRHIADNGWVWHPVGIVTSWSVDRWLDDNVWESEDGPSRRALCWRDYFWDGPWCWIDDTHLAVWGYGEDSENLIDAVQIFDVTTGDQRWFAGPDGSALFFDRVLVSTAGDSGTTVWDVVRGARLASAPVHAARYHPTAKTFITLAGDSSQIVESRLCGLDAGAEWNRGVVVDLARTIARDRGFDDLPVLGDALEVAGCSDVEMLAHCQQSGSHGDRCWVIDRLSRR
jgi:hypothetical protein